MKIAVNIIFVFVLLFQHQLMADERILSFHSDIHVFANGSMSVEETITVRSEQNSIQRGIYRDFPTTYRDRFGNRYRVDFNLVSVLRDGVNENYFTENQSNGVRTYIGQQNVILPPGEYTYTLNYSTDRQLGFFENHDELYWNVTGNGWLFPIDRASARVFLPQDIPGSRINALAYTGVAGSEEQAFSENRYSGGTVYIEATRGLGSGEGLTIVIGWPKGYIVEPTWSEKFAYFYRDNRHVVIGAVGLLLVFAYYLFIWSLVGRDPERGVIFPRYAPPDNYSPASLRYIGQMAYDSKTFATALINLAVKGYLTISEYDNVYEVDKTGKDVKMAAGEKALVNKLFGASSTRQFKQSNHHYIKEALEAHAASLRRDYEKKYFITNSGYFFLGMLLTVISVIGSFLSMLDSTWAPESIFIMFWLSGWSFGVYFLINNAWQAWKRVIQGKSMFAMIAAIHATIFAVIFTGIEITVITTFPAINWGLLSVIVFGAGINWLFYELLKAPTRVGRKLLDKVEGFRTYLDIAEKQELEARHPEGRCPELFEAYLPYALALDIEQRWAEKFADVLVKVSAAGNVQYHPRWYSGSSWDQNHIGDFSSSLGSSFSSAISSASTAPGSSSGGGGFSGGGGGGSSGGGGGGGGGGGW